MAQIHILKGGLLTTVQDSGRHGYQMYGMPVAGAMDLVSFRLANALVRNHPDAAVLETTLTGPEILFRTGSGEPAENSSAIEIAITGADMQPEIVGRPVPMYAPIQVADGDVLRFRGLKWGCRSYIAFSGGLDVPEVMGSRSTYIRAQIGGYKGRSLREGDIIQLGEETENHRISSADAFIKSHLPEPGTSLPGYLQPRRIRIIAGPEARRAGSAGIKTFLTTEYKVTPQSDRMGLRLSGEPIKVTDNAGASGKPGHDIISAGIAPGTIQLPGDGQPIILTADRQTTGGYLRLAFVIKEDLPLVAQLKAGDAVRFEEYHK
jgi:biotin-dependent carboxylase-like uncharacterized protein